MTSSGAQHGSVPAIGALPVGLGRRELVAAARDGLVGVPDGATVVVGLSGGPDSTALAFLAAEARPDLTIVLVHVRHGLRDDRDDVAAATVTARFLGVDLQVVDVAVEPHGDSLEGAARAQRHAALQQVASKRRAKAILLGHTADDQAETLLLRVARGTGVDGLSGMTVHAGLLCRPLLRVRRDDVHQFVEQEGLEVVQDPTNRDTAHARNRLRHEVMPSLTTLGPDVVGAVARLAELSAADSQWLEDSTAELTAAHVRTVGPVHSIRQDTLAALPVGAGRRVVRHMVVGARQEPLPPTAGQVEAIRLLGAGAMDVPGAEAVAAGGWLTLAPAALARPAQVDLVIDGRTAWPAANWMIEVNSDDGRGAARAQLGLLRVWEPPRVRVHDGLVAPGGRTEWAQVVLGGLGPQLPRLHVRPRRPGDRIVIAGGTRKLQDVFVDAGVPRPIRDLVPVVVADDRVLWVPGLAADDAALRTGRAVPQVHLAIRSLR